MDAEKMEQETEEIETDCLMEEDEGTPFLQLPEEMFLHICSFLDVKDILSLSRVCKKFNCMLQSNDTWRAWMVARWGRHAPIVDTVNDNWKKKCFVLEKDWKIFKGPYEHQKINHDGSDLDAVLLVNGGRHCITGSRTREITIYDTSTPEVLSKCAAHEGWVWKLKYLDDRLYSTSWDSTIKIWDFNSSLVEVDHMSCYSPVLSVDVEKNGVIYAGTYTGMRIFDRRAGGDVMSDVSSNHSAILTLNLLGTDIIMGHENKVMSVWDTRTKSYRQFVKKDTYAVCAQVLNNILYVGDNCGNIRVYQMKESQLTESAFLNVGPKKPVSNIKITDGSILTNCSNNVTTFLPFKPLKAISEINANGAAITSMDYSNGIVALGTPFTVEFRKSVI